MLFLSVAGAHADKIFLTNGTVLEGDIIGKSEFIVKIFVNMYLRPIAIEKNFVDSIEFGGKVFLFDSLKLNTGTDYNPSFRVTPVVSKMRPRVRSHIGADSTIISEVKREVNKDARRQNLLFNAPVRWGSAGMGYSISEGIHSRGGDGFLYDGTDFSVRSILFSLRYNFGHSAKVIGSIVSEFGYGKTHLNSIGKYPEIAVMRHLSFRYVFCNPRWLIAPGLSAGVRFQRGVVSKVVPLDSLTSGIEEFVADRPFASSTLLPFVGADINVYDALAFHASISPMSKGKSNIIYASLLFLIPFRL